MKHGALVIVLVAAAFGNGFHGPACAQTSIGGAKKPAALGGPVKQMSPVVPVNRAGSVVPANRPSQIVGVNKPAPVAPAIKPVPGISAAGAPLSAHAKCAGPCVTKGKR